MKGHTNNPNGRPRKTDCRQLVSFRLHPDTLARLTEMAESQGVAKTTIVENLIIKNFYQNS